MKRVFFDDANHIISLPDGHHDYAHVANVVTTCWYFSFKERLKLLLTGRIYHVTTKQHTDTIHITIDNPIR
jgi:hypothetical protein